MYRYYAGIFANIFNVFCEQFQHFQSNWWICSGSSVVVGSCAIEYNITVLYSGYIMPDS